MSIEALKEQARTLEQKENWGKAIDLYTKAIAQLVEEEQPDIGLYNRVGDLQVRQVQLEEGVKNYEKAIELYVEAELPNNAIAVCKKIVRNMPMRHSVYLKMGQIRGGQGFITEARQNFLTYAERMQAQGDIDEGLRALGELADLAPEDVEIRLAIAGQMRSHGRTDDAVAQLQAGYRTASERGLPTDLFETMLGELGAEPSASAPATTAGGSEDALGAFGDIMLPTGEPGEAEPEPEPAEASADALGGFEIESDHPAAEDEREEVGGEEEAAPLPIFDVPDSDDEEEVPLPTFEFSDSGEEVVGEAAALLPMDEEELGEDDEAEPLPLLGDGFADETGEESVLDAAAFGEREEKASTEYVSAEEELPEIELGGLSLEPEEAAAGSAPAREGAMEEARSESLQEGAPPSLPLEPEAVPGPSFPAATTPGQLAPRPQRDGSEKDPMGHEALAERGDIAGAMAALRKLFRNDPNDLALRQRMVDYAGRLGDPAAMVVPWLELAESLERAHLPAKAKPIYEQILTVDAQNEGALRGLGQAPATSPADGEDFVDLGSLILDEEEDEKSTRFVVAYEEPSGDEKADFAKMLGQFRAKVAENLSTDDVKARQDLGTAYKEMGLIDEAISEFQHALRSSADHLPTFELLGQCFMDKGEPEAALRTLNRALEAPREVEDDLLGIYYWLGRAHEQVGNKVEAVEFYDRVFSLDINFADVTERLRALR